MPRAELTDEERDEVGQVALEGNVHYGFQPDDKHPTFVLHRPTDEVETKIIADLTAGYRDNHFIHRTPMTHRHAPIEFAEFLSDVVSAFQSNGTLSKYADQVSTLTAEQFVDTFPEYREDRIKWDAETEISYRAMRFDESED